jgi:hypothetical protein
MPNNFSTIKLNQTSEKFYLIRLVPRRVVNSNLVSIGGGKYQATFNYPISSVMANDVSLTKVTTVLNPGEYSYDETTKALIVYSTPSASNIIVVNYYVFLTGGRYRVLNENPEDVNTPLRDWIPRIKTNPEISNSIENVIQGNLQISLSGMTIINDENEFEDYLTADDSFNLCEAKIWLCLDGVENIQKIYNGRVAGIGLSGNTVQLQFEDQLGGLLLPAYMGDDAGECYFTQNDFPNMNPNYSGALIHFIIGKASRFKTISESNPTLPDAQALDQSTLYNAICTDYDNELTTSNNREWGVCRVSGEGFLDFGFTPSNIDNTDPNFTRLTGTAGETGKFFIGDTFVVTQVMVNYYLRVIYTDRINNYLYCSKEGGISTGAVVTPNDCPSVLVTNESNETYLCLYGRDYTATVTTTSGGNKYLKITFVNNFETNHPGLAVLDPGKYKVKYRVRPDYSKANHAEVVKELLINAGLTVDAVSITAAKAALDSNCAFSIPQFDEGDFSRYVDYIQLILKSALSFLTLANDFEIEYRLFQSPTSTFEITDIDIIQNTYAIEINYKDMAHQIIAYNPHWSHNEGIVDASATEISLKAKYLHKINNANRFRHVLEKITDRIASIAGVYAERKALYKFDTKAINLDSILGDDLKIIRDGILGNETNKELKVISISKSPMKSKIIATDLLGL